MDNFLLWLKNPKNAYSFYIGICVALFTLATIRAGISFFTFLGIFWGVLLYLIQTKSKNEFLGLLKIAYWITWLNIFFCTGFIVLGIFGTLMLNGVTQTSNFNGTFIVYAMIALIIFLSYKMIKAHNIYMESKD